MTARVETNAGTAADFEADLHLNDERARWFRENPTRDADKSDKARTAGFPPVCTTVEDIAPGILAEHHAAKLLAFVQCQACGEMTQPQMTLHADGSVWNLREDLFAGTPMSVIYGMKHLITHTHLGEMIKPGSAEQVDRLDFAQRPRRESKYAGRAKK